MRHRSESQSNQEFVREVLESQGWEIEYLEDERALRGAFKGENGEFWAYAMILDDVDFLLCYSLFSWELPRDLEVAAAELIAHLNAGLRVGNFELNFAQGEVRFKSSVDFRGLDLSDTLILNVFVPCVYVMDKCLHALYALLVERKSVSEARALAYLHRD